MTHDPRDALDPLEMLLDAARYAERNSGGGSNLAWAKAAREAVKCARESLTAYAPGSSRMASIVTCCVTGAIPGDGGACGDCDPCIMGKASVPEAVKRLIAEKNSLIQRIGELEDASRPDAGCGVREALDRLLVDDDSEDADDECELCDGRGTVDAYTARTNDSRSQGRDEIGCPACIERSHSRRIRFALSTPPAAVETFQSRVQPWMMACFGPEISADRVERNHRFLEEALELVQSNGCTQSEAHQLVDYVYGRPAGETNQEIGGVMVTLAALCLALDEDMHKAGEAELARIWTKVEKIRAKQAAKPKHSPLPGPSEAAAVESNASAEARLRETFLTWLDRQIENAATQQKNAYASGNDRIGERCHAAHSELCRVMNKLKALSAGGDETKKSEGRRGNQPEGCTGPHRESGETNSGSTGDSILTRSAVRPSEPSTARREVAIADDVVAYLHRSKFGHANDLSFEVATNPDWTSEPLYTRPEKAADVSNHDRREIVARLAYGLSNNPDLWDHPHSVLIRDRSYEVAGKILAALDGGR